MIRQILINEPNSDLRHIHFNVLMIDGITPALDEVGGQPEINISETGWNTNAVSTLTSIGFGNYYAILNDDAVNSLGVILSHYKGNNTLDCKGESVEIIQNYRDVEIFNENDFTSTQSYVTLSEADKYFATILKSKPWDIACVSDKLKTLIMATRDIDRLKFNGIKTSQYVSTYQEFITNQNSFIETQFLEFPRNGSTEIPTDIKIACCEIAITYLNGTDMELEYASFNVINQAFSSVRDSFDRRFISENLRAGINSTKAWTYLKPFLADPRYMRLARV